MRKCSAYGRSAYSERQTTTEAVRESVINTDSVCVRESEEEKTATN